MLILLNLCCPCPSWTASWTGRSVKSMDSAAHSCTMWCDGSQTISFLEKDDPEYWVLTPPCERQPLKYTRTRFNFTVISDLITSRCSGNEPALIKDRIRETVGNRAHAISWSSLPRRHSFEKEAPPLRDEPKECLRGRLLRHGLVVLKSDR